MTTMANLNPPGLFSVPRITTLLSSLLVALGSGTNYAFSAYAPQLSARLHLTHTRLNIIGLAGNMGVYSTAAIIGRVVDARGPRYMLVCACTLLLVGYSAIRHIYDNGSPPSGSISSFTFWLLIVCSFMTGAGGSGGLTSSVNATAKSFPDRARATTTGIVLSGFGLSAFFFSTISHTIFRGDTSSFLLVLALGTSFPMIIGFFLVRPIPLPTHEDHTNAEYSIVNEATPVVDLEASLISQHENDSHTPLLTPIAEDPPPFIRHIRDDSPVRTSTSLELSPTRSISPGMSSHRRSGNRAHRPSFGSVARMLDTPPNISGRQLWTSSDFWLIFTIMSLLSGTGVMYINNVGSISQALFAKGNPQYDEVVASHWQATQVSAISITNFTGRILIGIISDFAKNRLHLPRSYCISLVAVLFIISQLMAVLTDDVTELWKASLALGLAYGSMFGLFPTMTFEWFGMPHFSENWGFLSLSPMLGGNLFSIAFGRNLDAHTPSSTEHLSSAKSNSTIGRAGTPSEPQCLDGRNCYVASLHVTIAACCLALALSIWAGWRDRKKTASIALAGKMPPTEVVWEEDGEE